MTAERQLAVEYFERRRGIVTLWFGLLAGPAAWFLHLNISYSLVRLICQSGGVWLLHLTTLVSLILAGAGVWVAWRSWLRLGEPAVTTGAGTLGRSRFMALGGIALSGFFLLVVILAWVPEFVLEPCVAGGKVGPPLTGFAVRTYIAGNLSNAPANLVAWIVQA